MNKPIRATEMSARTEQRLYRDLAQRLAGLIAEGFYPIGERLPAERELVAQFGVSRPTVREALIALEVQGLIEVRIGSGAYVRRKSAEQDEQAYAITAFELTEARMLIEGETAALAATQITAEELAKLERLLLAIEIENREEHSFEKADREFHLTIAQATRNQALLNMIDALWDIRSSSPACALLLEKARSANVKPVVEEHRTILEALRARDPAGARVAMRGHLNAVLEHLLFRTEEDAAKRARQASEAIRARFKQLI